MGPHSILPRLLLVLTILVAGARGAHAHGGNFKADDGGGANNPSNDIPTAPPPAPTITLPPTGRPSTPIAPLRTWRPAGWQVWWQLNVEAYLPVPGQQRIEGVVTPSETNPTAPRPTVPLVPVPPRWPGHVEEAARGLLYPFLGDLIDPARGHPDALVAVALVAAGRSARDASLVHRIQGWTVDRRASLEVRESAVLALGLLRRSDPARQLAVEQLGDLRDFLLALFDDAKNPTRVRAFALFSLALLSDQPYGEATLEKDGRMITRALWRRLEEPRLEMDLTIAILTALSRQPPAGVPDGVREGLKRIAMGRPLFSRAWDDLERSHALAALGHLGGEGVDAVLLRALRSPLSAEVLQTSALIGLSLRAPTLSSEERVQIARDLRELLRRDRHWMVRGLGELTFAALLGADLREGRHAVLDETDLLEHLVQGGRTETSQIRPFSAVALGLVAHHVPRSSRSIGLAIDKVRKTLVWGLQWGRGADDVVAAYAVAAGLAGAHEAIPFLLEFLGDRGCLPVLRAHSALALGQIGDTRPEIVEALVAATRERLSAFLHVQAVRALALLGTPEVADELLDQMSRQEPTRPALAAIAGALGRVKDPRVTPLLVDLVRDGEALLQVRVAAVMALGFTFDPEVPPSRFLLTTDANYPALTWSLAQVFNIM